MADRLENERVEEYDPGNNLYADGDDDFDGLYANIPIFTHTSNNNNNPPPPPALPTHEIQQLSQLMTREEEDRKIKEFIRRSEMDWQRYLRTGVQGPGPGPGPGPGRGRGRGRGVNYNEAEIVQKQPPAGYVCHRCGAPEEHYIYDCPTNGDPAFDFDHSMRWERERKVVPLKKNFVTQPDEKAFERAIKGIPTLQSSPEVKAEAENSVKPASTPTVVPPPNAVQPGTAQRCFIRKTPYPGYVCHRCLKPDDHYIKECPTNGDPAYDHYTRPYGHRVHVKPSVPHLNYGVAPSMTRPFLNYNVTQGYPNPAQGFPPVKHNSWPGTQLRGNPSINNNGYTWRRTQHTGNTLPADQSQNVNMQVQRPKQELHQVPLGNQNTGACPPNGLRKRNDREGIDQHESRTKQSKRHHNGDVNNP